MTFSSSIATVSVGISIALLSSASMADTGVSAYASIGNVQFQLIDLNLNDEVSPHLHFIDANTTSFAQLQNGFNSNSSPVTKNIDSNNYDPLQTNVSSSQSQSFSGSTGAFFSDVSSKGYQQSDGFFSGYQFANRNFSLSANTAIVITGAISGGTISAQPLDFNHTASSLASLTLSQNIPLDPDGAATVGIQRDWTSPFGNTPSFETFSLQFVNNSSQSVEVNYFANVSASGLVQTTPAVPEPETYAMMLSGLGMLAFLARRKARNAVK
ncbi:MAG: hypothetical protein RL748_1976 [Pseudomonadota bacterium]|jgi:hypothetical protein